MSAEIKKEIQLGVIDVNGHANLAGAGLNRRI